MPPKPPQDANDMKVVWVGIPTGKKVAWSYGKKTDPKITCLGFPVGG